MKNLLYFSVLLLLISSCTVQKKPVFIKVANVKVVSVTLDTIRLKAKAFFENPNDVGGKISTDEIKVIINDTELAQVSSEEFKVPAIVENENFKGTVNILFVVTNLGELNPIYINSPYKELKNEVNENDILLLNKPVTSIKDLPQEQCQMAQTNHQ